jgi:hypothetical protein
VQTLLVRRAAAETSHVRRVSFLDTFHKSKVESPMSKVKNRGYDVGLLTLDPLDFVVAPVVYNAELFQLQCKATLKQRCSDAVV